MNKYYRINQNIKASLIRLVGPGLNETLSLEEALRKARESGLDLVEVGPNSQPPTVKIIDFKKFLFELKRKERKSEKTRTTLKELRFSPVIAANDLNRRVEKAKEFLKAGNSVKITIFFRGREITHPELGRKKIEVITALLLGFGKKAAEAKLLGKTLSLTFVPGK